MVLVSANPASATASPKLTAGAIVRDLKAKGLPVYPHGSLQPDQYDPAGSKYQSVDSFVSGYAFFDTRVVAGWAAVDNQVQNFVSEGGAVEIFATHAVAVGAAQYFQAGETVDGSDTYGNEVDFVAGDVLLRLSGGLPTSALKSYEAPLAAIVGSKVTEIGHPGRT
jgi:hypothetical protein